MSGRLLAQARKDAMKFATSGGFEIDINLTTPDGLTTVDVTGLSTNHWKSFDLSGNAVNSSSSHIDIPEQLLVNLNYPVRNNGKVALIDHKVKLKDNTNTLRTFTITECHPNGTTGLLVCILGKYKE